jgi:MFS family permease
MLNPGVFGQGRGYSRAIALTGMSWMGGLLVGPILAGIVVERLGFFELQFMLSKCSTVFDLKLSCLTDIGLTSVLAGLLAASNLSHSAREKRAPT